MNRPPGVARPLRTTLEMIKFSHTIFALPFAVLSAVLAAGGWPAWPTLAKILVAMIGARSAALAHNRLADREIDAANPRTESRALPSGALSVTYVRVFLVVSVVMLPLLLGLAVLFWTAGFDIIYALQDEEHDRRSGLRSIPARVGSGGALVISALFHAVMVVLLIAVWRVSGGGRLFALGIAATAAALVYQHAIVRPRDLSRVNAAFFTANGFVSIALAVCGIADVLAR